MPIPRIHKSAPKATSPPRVVAKPGVLPAEPQNGGVVFRNVIGRGRLNDDPPIFSVDWAPAIAACLEPRQNRRMCDISWTLHSRLLPRLLTRLGKLSIK
jgi:hypothetical protein